MEHRPSSDMIELLLEKYGSSLAWYMDDGFFLGSKLEIESFWHDVRRLGPKYGYNVNNKSSVLNMYNIDPHYWAKLGLDCSIEGIEILGAPVGKKSFEQNFMEEKFDKIALTIDKFQSIALLYPQQSFRLFYKIY